MTLTVKDYEEVLKDHQRLVRELDVALNGAGAARQATLGDILAQVKNEHIRSPQYVGEVLEPLSTLVLFKGQIREAYQATSRLSMIPSYYWTKDEAMLISDLKDFRVSKVNVVFTGTEWLPVRKHPTGLQTNKIPMEI